MLSYVMVILNFDLSNLAISGHFAKFNSHQNYTLAPEGTNLEIGMLLGENAQ